MPISAAVLIGVSNYSIYDHSIGNPIGTSDLFSPARNVHAMWDLCGRLGFMPQHIAVLSGSSPQEVQISAHPALFAEATRASILKTVTWFAHQLAEDEEGRGLLYYNGHGARKEGAALCPVNTKVVDGQLENLVSLAEIGEILESLAPKSSVTFILDSCQSGLARRPLGQALGSAMGHVKAPRPQDVLLSAAKGRSEGYEALFGGTWRGAFTWALLSGLEQYRRRMDSGFIYFDRSLGSLISAAGSLLSAVGFEQTPQLSPDNDKMRSRIFLQAAGVPKVVPTFKLEVGGTSSEELSPGTNWGIVYNIYQYTSDNGQPQQGDSLGTLYVTSSQEQSGDWKSSYSYWDWNSGVTLSYCGFPEENFMLEYSSDQDQPSSPPSGANVRLFPGKGFRSDGAFHSNFWSDGPSAPTYTIWRNKTQFTDHEVCNLGVLRLNSTQTVWLMLALAPTFSDSSTFETADYLNPFVGESFASDVGTTKTYFEWKGTEYTPEECGPVCRLSITVSS